MRRFSDPVLRGYGSLRSEEEGKTLQCMRIHLVARGEEFLRFTVAPLPSLSGYWKFRKVFVPLPKAGALRRPWGAVLACWGLTSP